MALHYRELEVYAQYLAQQLIGRHLNHFLEHSRGCYFFRISDGRRLSIVLEGSNPRIYIAEGNLAGSGINAPIPAYFRKELSNAEVTGIKTLSGDRIIDISLSCLDSAFRPIKRDLVIELFPNKSNLILLDEEGLVLICQKASSLDSKRPLFKGVRYEAPEKNAGYSIKEADSFDAKKYEEEMNALEESLLQKRRRELYGELFSLLRRKKKSSLTKQSKIEGDIALAKKHLSDGEYGDFIYMNFETVNPRLGYMDFYGEKIELDPSKSAAENAENFYRRAKRAKATINSSTENLNKAKEEAKRYDEALEIAENADEELLTELSEEFLKAKKRQNAKKKDASKLLKKGNMPHKVSDGKGTVYLFGKNAAQNDFLSFHLDTAPNHIWMHIKDEHGAHLIIKKDSATPEELDFAASLCLLCSKREDGEVIYSPHRQIRKGEAPGQVVLKTYQSLYLRHINPEARKAFEELQKAE